MDDWREAFAPLAAELKMSASFHALGRRIRVALLCSKTLHCPLEILARMASGNLNIRVPGIISNHHPPIIFPITARCCR